MKIKHLTIVLSFTLLSLNTLLGADPDLEFNSIAIDPNNTVWIGTNQYLYSMLPDGEMKKHSESINGISYSDLPVIDIAQYAISQPYSMLLATSKGAVSYSSGNGDELSNASVLYPEQSIKAVGLTSNLKWTVTPNGLLVNNGSNDLTIHYYNDAQKNRLLQSNVTSLVIKNDTAYVTTTGDPSLYCVDRFIPSVDGVTGASPYGKWGPCPLAEATCMAFGDGGEQWFGNSEGLYWHQSCEYLTGWQQFTTTDGLVSNQVQCLLVADGYVYAGTTNGISQVKRDQSTGAISVVNYTIDNGLKENNIIDMAMDSEKKLYALSPTSISIINTPSSIEETSTTSSHISLYPNPATDYIKVRFDNASNVRIGIQNMSGVTVKQLFDGAVNANEELTLSTEDLTPGTYLCSIHAGKDFYATLFIIE